jgi:lipoprotein LpqB-like beta-propeller protein
MRHGRPRRTTVTAALLSAAALLLAGCTGVPESSAPQIVNPVGVASAGATPAIAPSPNADPRTIVRGFLTANALADEHHTSARDFLTPDAKNRWSDTSVTVLASEQVSNFVRGSVTVRGQKLGTISASGIYTPVLQGTGDRGAAFEAPFGMKQVNGQWRVNTLTTGLIITADSFQRSYQQRKLYFYDLMEQHLIPDPRYTSLNRASLADWLVGQLASAPRPELQNAVSNELPAQTDPRRVTVTLGSPTTIEVPGADQLDLATRGRLAAQLALTLNQVRPGSVMSILDGGRPVVVSAGGTSVFTASGFSSTVSPPVPRPRLFYLRNHAVVDADGKALPGELGSGQQALTSVALATRPGLRGDLLAAATSGPDSDARLLVGTQRTSLHLTSLRGRLSRPAWAPGRTEAWVGDGSRVYRVNRAGKSTEVPVSGTGALAGRISALRFSPDGSRVALVLGADGGTGAQVWVGLVVRPRGQAPARVDSLEPISPLDVAVTDVAWNDELKLFTIGTVPGSGEGHVYEVQVDGSLWTSRAGTQDLPGAPDSITVAENVPAWVSVAGTVWAQSGGSWTSPNGSAAQCTNPIYLE